MYENSIKQAARISHTKLDNEIQRLDAYACSELIRVGVPSSVITLSNKLIESAVIAYAMSEIGNEKNRLHYKESWDYQKDNLRKHEWSVTDEE